MELSTEVLVRLTAQALSTFLGGSPGFEARTSGAVWLVLSGEPVADLNYLLALDGSARGAATFGTFAEVCADRDLPFVAMVAPEAVQGLSESRRRLGLEHVVDWPLMVCPASAVRAHADPDLQISRATAPEDLRDSASVLARAFGMPEDSVTRTVTQSTVNLPGFRVSLARRGGEALSTVTVTRHGSVAGIWAMGTAPEAQGKGVGKALLSTVMAEEKDRGVEAFFLGATPAGKPLYDRLGYRTVAELQAWVRGVTTQA
ncbi:MAG: GNAT family N-acetyltransferase [Acidobacteriota bacterium]|jgi:GNAT superfamily N-acetyltransferase